MIKCDACGKEYEHTWKVWNDKEALDEFKKFPMYPDVNISNVCEDCLKKAFRRSA